ncbi:WD40-repeat-containing domain protein [Lipomyces oligophaga]|uniref:WD40-repeat-containing domain protein n=1 Tax=Lipomyces oligophaga TaxID=45792 RepID=UPI0034CFC8AB
MEGGEANSVTEIPVEEEEFIDVDSALQVVEDEGEEEDHPMSDDDGQEDEPDEEDEIVQEIDMSNNSSAYFDKHSDSIFLVNVHSQAPLAVTGGGDDTGYVWTYHNETPQLLATLSGHTDSLVTGGFTPNGKFVVTGGMDGRVRLWRARAKGHEWEFWDSIQEVEEVTWISFHPTQTIFAFGSNDGSAWVYSYPKLENLCTLYGHTTSCTAGVFVPSGQPEETPVDEQEINLLTISDDGSVISWSIPSGEQNYKLMPTQFHYEAPWINLSLHQSGTSVAIGSADGKVTIVGTRTGNIIATLDVLGATGKNNIPEEEQSIEGIAWCDTMSVLAVGLVANVICLFDTGSWRVRRTLDVGDSITKIEFVPNSAVLVSSSMDGILRRWDVRNGDLLWKGTGHSSGILGFALADHGNTIVTASDEGVSLVYR